MRQVNKNLYTKPTELEYTNCQNKIRQAIILKNKHEFSSTTYGAPAVRVKLIKIYNSKCAFCETNTTSGATLQVEHYRPKARLSDEPHTHKGYYWLGYEWTNLLLACAKCNRKKWDQFPIKNGGIRVRKYITDTSGKIDFSSFNIRSTNLINEQALLLNPEVINPIDYLFFLPSGKIKGKGYPESEKTIEICNLNRRELCINRKKIRDNIIRKYMKYFDDYNNGGPPTTLNDLKYLIIDRLIDVLSIYTKNEPYSMYARQLLVNFDFFIANKFQPKEKTILMDAYQQFKNLNSKVINAL